MAAPKGHEPYAGCEKGGRPVKYTTEFIEAEAEALEKWMQQPDSIYFKRFSFDRGYSYKRLSEFAEVNQKFSDVLERAHEWQETRLVEGGLKNEFNGAFCKFVMGNTCGWVAERTETKLSGSATDPFACVLNIVDGFTKELINDKGQ